MTELRPKFCDYETGHERKSIQRMRMEYRRLPCMACLRHPGVGDGRLQEYRVCASNRAPHRYRYQDAPATRLDIRARLDLHPRARRHGMDRAMAHPLARPPAAGHHLRDGARYAASGDRYLASAIGHARYLSPWQPIDVVATDTNIHRQYSDICHDHTVDNIYP